jgi:hypothetical protein
MIASIQGPKGAGKTDIALRGTPRPLTFLDFDYGTEGIGSYDNDELLEGVNLIQYDPFRGSYLGQDETTQAEGAKPEIDRFLADFRAAIKDKVRTLVVDTFTVAWAAQRLGNPERRWVELDAEFHGLIRSAFISPHTNLILIHHEKKDWAKDASGKSFPSGSYSIDGMENIQTAMQLAIRMQHTPRQEVEGVVIQEPDFTAKILKARDNVDLVGHVEKGKPSFEDLCTLVCPSVDWSV